MVKGFVETFVVFLMKWRWNNENENEIFCYRNMEQNQWLGISF